MDSKGHSDEVSDGNENHVTGLQRKKHIYYKVEKNLAKLYSCSSMLWKINLVSDEMGYLAEEISKNNVEGVDWFLLKTYRDIQEQRNDLKTYLLIKR